MKLYIVRMVINQEIVGFFWARNPTCLWDDVDTVVSPTECEYQPVTGAAAVVFPSPGSARIGFDLPADDTEAEYITAEWRGLHGAAPCDRLRDYVFTAGKWNPFPSFEAHMCKAAA